MIEFIVSNGLTYVLMFFAGAAVKTFVMVLINQFRAVKIIEDIRKSQRIKTIIQTTEFGRAAVGADRVLVLQAHNGGKWNNGQSMTKLSLINDLSIDRPDHVQRSKVFDRALNDVLVDNLSDILAIASSRHSFDIISIAELSRDFYFYRELKTDGISYIVVVKIQSKKAIVGYLLFVFTGESTPIYTNETRVKLIDLGAQVGEIIRK